MLASMYSHQFATDVQVDHIIPLRGGKWIPEHRCYEVSGLHAPWNLRILPAVENLKKHNKFCQSEALSRTGTFEDAVTSL